MYERSSHYICKKNLNIKNLHFFQIRYPQLPQKNLKNCLLLNTYLHLPNARPEAVSEADSAAGVVGEEAKGENV